jgi:hypothetical protein
LSETVRRIFLTPGEIPERLVGALRGDSASLRRILGARRAGRIGAALLLAGALAAFPLRWLLAGLLLHVALALVLQPWPRAAPRLSVAQRLRLASWTTGPTLLAFAVLRFVWPESLVPGLLGLALGQALLIRGLSVGLRATTPEAHPDP